MTEETAANGEGQQVAVDGKLLLKVLKNLGLILPNASHVKAIASIDGYLSVTAEYKPESAIGQNTHRVEEGELIRLRAIEQMSSSMIERLNKGEVDYDLIANLEKVING